MNSPILRVKQLNVRYPTDTGLVRAVDDVSFEVREGEKFGIAGESGCGKSTLAHAIPRLLRPPGYVEGGEVLFKGVELLKLDHKELQAIRGKRISLIPQNSMSVLNPVLTIRDQIADIFASHGEKKSKAEMDAVVIELLSGVGLPPKVAKMYPHELSGGMRQRAVMAISVSLRPELMIADEPTTALDVVVQRGVLQLLADLRSKLNMSLILVTHDMGVHAQLVDRLCVMYAGKVSEIGQAAHLFKEPIHPYSRALISSIPSIDDKRELAGLKGVPPNLIEPPSGCRFYPRCPYVEEKCRSKPPELVEIEPERLVACHLYGDTDV